MLALREKLESGGPGRAWRGISVNARRGWRPVASRGSEGDGDPLHCTEIGIGSVAQAAIKSRHQGMRPVRRGPVAKCEKSPQAIDDGDGGSGYSTFLHREATPIEDRTTHAVFTPRRRL